MRPTGLPSSRTTFGAELRGSIGGSRRGCRWPCRDCRRGERTRPDLRPPRQCAVRNRHYTKRYDHRRPPCGRRTPGTVGPRGSTQRDGIGVRQRARYRCSRSPVPSRCSGISRCTNSEAPFLQGPCATAGNEPRRLQARLRAWRAGTSSPTRLCPLCLSRRSRWRRSVDHDRCTRRQVYLRSSGLARACPIGSQFKSLY